MWWDVRLTHVNRGLSKTTLVDFDTRYRDKDSDEPPSFRCDVVSTYENVQASIGDAAAKVLERISKEERFVQNAMPGRRSVHFRSAAFRKAAGRHRGIHAGIRKCERLKCIPGR
jgi:hypothetical protein